MEGEKYFFFFTILDLIEFLKNTSSKEMKRTKKKIKENQQQKNVNGHATCLKTV